MDYFHELSQKHGNTAESKKSANLLYGEILLENSLYTTAHTFYSYFSKTLEANDPYLRIIQEHLSDILSEEGNFFEAEQELRFLLLKNPDSQALLSKLVQNALRAKDWNTAWQWHKIRDQKIRKADKTDDSVGLDIIIEKIQILSYNFV